MEKNVTRKEEKDALINAFTMLGLPMSFTTEPKAILQSFAYKYDLAKKEGLDTKKLIANKSLAMQYIISEQMKRRNYFNIESPFNNTCTACKGSGELFRFNQETIEIKCKTCKGEKVLHNKDGEKCSYCKDGRFIRRFPEGGGINIECNKCHGTGITPTKCPSCRGKGTAKKTVMAHTIKSTTPCTHCNSLGFIETKPEQSKKKTKSLGNTVLSKELAALIKA